MKLKLKKCVLEDELGRKMSISFEESYLPEEIGRVLGKLQDVEPTVEEKPQIESESGLITNCDFDSLSIREKLELIVKQIKHGWFTSDHIRELYLYHFHEEIKPSTVSTYLARLFEENELERRGSRARREYRVAEKQVKPIEFISQS